MNRIAATVAAGSIAVGAALAVAAPAAATASPHTVSPHTVSPHTVAPHIVGGAKAPSTRWEVQLEFTQDDGTYGCTGEQISASWVLTARHCVDGTDSMDVYQSNSTSRRGTAHAADDWSFSPTGDVGLIHLAKAAKLTTYAPLSLTYTAKSSGTGTIMGYGLRADQADPSGLYQASVDLDGSSTDAYRGRAQHVLGVTGASNHGDSGGALVVGGKVVAVCSTGDTADPGSDIHAGANYAVLAQAKSWLTRTTKLSLKR